MEFQDVVRQQRMPRRYGASRPVPPEVVLAGQWSEPAG